MRFEQLFEKQTRIYKSLVDYKIKWFRQHKLDDKKQRIVKDKELEIEWFNNILDLVKKGKKLDRKTLNDISGMENSGYYLNKIKVLKNGF